MAANQKIPQLSLAYRSSFSADPFLYLGLFFLSLLHDCLELQLALKLRVKQLFLHHPPSLLQQLLLPFPHLLLLQKAESEKLECYKQIKYTVQSTGQDRQKILDLSVVTPSSVSPWGFM